jgi:tRNA/tmRNA/rRNA uracil-C5-methylase (TrmA/RlmC/RlmD family)
LPAATRSRASTAFPIFASNVFPGDVARVRLYEVKKGFAKAELVELVTPSAFRRAAPCPVADECGGCDWTALRLDRQLEAKRRILSESLRRIGKLDVATLPEIRVHPSPLNYRLRSRLHRDGDAVGFYAMRSNRVVPLARECEVVGVETARVAGGGRNLGGRWRAVATSASSRSASTRSRIACTRARSFRSIATSSARCCASSPLTRRENGEPATRRRSLRRRRLLHAADGASSSTASRMIEGSPLSARYAKMNVPWNVKVVEAPVEQHIEPIGKANFVFLDPPRAGARREVITAVAERTKERIAYLSCDPVTFARDATASRRGWRLSSLDLLDLFPNTHHVETLASFER